MPIEEYAKKFQKLHKERTGENLSLEEAAKNFIKLAEMVRLIYKPIKKADRERLDTFQVSN